ncbi:NAD(P)-dependent oxidoreductase [Hoeflea sp.]|uniref:NAD(P)-dependent oxidoreductase n=1 Tax=Hoeflea sp. TaxID=1940281 RepID=UPI003B02E54A
MGALENDRLSIAVIGLGVMGLPMATHLVHQGHQVHGIDIDEAARERFAENGGKAFPLSAEPVSDRDVVMTMLPEGTHVLDTYDQLIFGNVSSETILVDCSTIDVASARQLSEAAEAKGLSVVDAPVSGGSVAAGNGNLSLMVGANPDAFERAAPFLRMIGSKITHFGPPGCGQAAKACHNMICGITAMAVIEGFALADALDLDLEKFYALCAGAAAQSWTLENRCPVPGIVAEAPSSNDFAPGFAARLMAKDLGLAQKAAKSSGQETPFGEMAARTFAEFAGAGGGEKDFSAYYTALRKQSGKQV